MGSYYCHICGTYGDSDDGCEEDKNGDTCHEQCLEVDEEEGEDGQTFGDYVRKMVKTTGITTWKWVRKEDEENNTFKQEEQEEGVLLSGGQSNTKDKDLGQKKDGADL